MKNVGISAHNVVAITLMAAVGLLILKMLAGTSVANLPVVGNGVRWLAKA